MTTVTVNASTSYDVIIGKELLSRSGELCAEVIAPCRACIVTDANVGARYLGVVEASLRTSGFKTSVFTLPGGESSKSTEMLIELLEFMARISLTRSDCIIALGGGVVGDLGGFAAAVYMRGIKFIQMPTTLLAAVDSSVGGKTAVDLKGGKNLAGAFHQPSRVICDYQTLDTLAPETFADGCAEVIKYGAINDKDFFELFESGIKENIEAVIARCVASKRDIVEDDEFDCGKRQLLNLGHTVGHAIELLSSFGITHGSAVAMGMVIVTRAAVKLGYCPSEDLERLVKSLRDASLPTSCEFDADKLASAALRDKKRAGESITLVVPFGLGDSRLVKIPVNELRAFIAKGLEEE